MQAVFVYSQCILQDWQAAAQFDRLTAFLGKASFPSAFFGAYIFLSFL